MDLLVPAALFATGALFAAVFAISTVAFVTARKRGARAYSSYPTVVIENGAIVEANFDARHIIDARPNGDQLTSIRTWLGRHFDQVSALTSDVCEAGEMRLRSKDGRFEAIRDICADAVRLTIRNADDDVEIASHLEVEDMAELATLRANTGLSPFPLWRTNAAGDVIWVNQAYLEVGRQCHGPDAMRSWPIPHLFEDLSRPGRLKPNETHRYSLTFGEDGQVSWFECSVIEVEGDLLYTAMNIDEIMRAEGRLREVTQTLTKTFANLTIGLAVFGRNRNLTLFNPALTELTMLPVEFLASRPSLPVFLDRLREERMMPEPKDYKSWRDHLAQLEAEAVDGTFEETWTMPGGQTWRVTGRPHPDGAIAILFEDISVEMSLTRRFHQELDQSQEVLDTLDDAVAVFGIEGTLTQTNAAYRRLWHGGETPGLDGQSVREATRQWHKLTSPTPVWGDFRDFACETCDRLGWSAEVRLLDGRQVRCRFTPISNGATLVRFSVDAVAVEPASREIRRAV